MLAPTSGLALFPIWAGTRLRLNVNLVGVPALANNFVDKAHSGEPDVHLLAQCTPGSRILDRVTTGLERGRLIWCFTVVAELATTISLLATVPAAPVPRAVLTSGVVNHVRWWLRAWQPFVDNDEFVPVQLSNVAGIVSLSVTGIITVMVVVLVLLALARSICTHGYSRGTRGRASPVRREKTASGTRW